MLYFGFQISEIHRSLRETDVGLAFFTLVIEGSNLQILPLSSYYSTLKERKTVRIYLSKYYMKHFSIKKKTLKEE